MLSGDFGDVTQEQKDYLKVISESSYKMTRLVKSLLNVSRLELGTFVVEPKPTNIEKILDNTFREIEPKLKNKETKITKEIAIEEKVNIDPNLMEIIAQNLLSNAVKYTPAKGTIKVRLYKENNDIVFEVSDTGYGIPAESKDKYSQSYIERTM